MARNGDSRLVELEGDGNVDGDIAFIENSVKTAETGNVTYGTMVVDFTNRVEAGGYGRTARVNGAEFLIGTINMRLPIANTEQQGSARPHRDSYCLPG
jgi:hypothetical protein